MTVIFKDDLCLQQVNWLMAALDAYANIKEKVEIRLHESFADPVRTFRAPPYEVSEYLIAATYT